MMRLIVMGCGRTGARLATRFAAEGNDVRVIDRDVRAKRLLDPTFPGSFLIGNGYSRRILEGAGVADADAFVAVTSGDNTNIVGARTAKEIYRVPWVIARIYDPRRADIYRDLGIPTVASVSWTVHQIERMLAHPSLGPEISFGNGETVIVREPVPAYLWGRHVTDLDVDGEIRTVEVTRLGRSVLAGPEVRLRDGDVVTFAVSSRAMRRLTGILWKDGNP